ncbi:TMV resistance protein N-like [Neltuma alba]|uniref:TMV resistance protein N-like n=1 Tax=Neltuma alba TaxID=207710 RepID=UPI0010A332BC|nr:TMV resistance protein N-like [Prosopis alba]
MKVTKENFISGPSSSSRPIHVYLSFIGDNETCRFTDSLWVALESNDLNTFWDDKKLDPGDYSIVLPRHFLRAIRKSNIAIVVFSKSYASSIWCLEELSEIAERIHEPRYTVFPIFYDVDSSEVQKQSNSFEKAFAEHEQRFTTNLRTVCNWRLAIKQVANLPGWHVQREPEPQVIDDIIKELKRKMRELVYADVDLVGM